MRLLSTFSLVVFFAGSSCWGQIGDGPQAVDLSSKSVSLVLESGGPSLAKTTGTQSATEKLPVSDSIRRALEQPYDLEFDEQPWNEIEEQLESTYGFNIVLTHSAKDDALGPDDPISENLTGLRLKDGLRVMLKSHNATYVVKDGVLMIISRDDEFDAKYFTTEFVNVRSLLSKIAMLEKARIGKPKVEPRAELDKKNAQTIELVTPESLLTDLIRSSYRPDEWKKTGQGLATLEILGGIAVVSTTEESADGLRDFLTSFGHHLSQD